MTDDIAADVEAQIEAQGMAAYKVSDGEVFVFTTKTLESFTEASQKTGRVVVFIKTRAQA
jgi:hypothetical protein